MEDAASSADHTSVLNAALRDRRDILGTRLLSFPEEFDSVDIGDVFKLCFYEASGFFSFAEKLGF